MADIEHAPSPTEPPPSYEDAAGEHGSSKATGSTSEKPRLVGGPPVVRVPFALDLPVLQDLRAKRVILASKSPRRRQLLAQIGLTNIEIVPSGFPEDLPKTLTPFDYVLQTASAKCMEVYRAEVRNTAKGEPALVLSADTVVVSDTGAILEKPRNEVQHRNMLRQLRDMWSHSVVTAVVAMAPLASAREPGYTTDTYTEETRVYFDRNVRDEVLEAYMKTREGADKAGGYGIQGIGAILVERIEGGFENVVGLPLRGTLNLIEKVMAKALDEETLEGELDDEDEDGEP